MSASPNNEPETTGAGQPEPVSFVAADAAASAASFADDPGNEAIAVRRETLPVPAAGLQLPADIYSRPLPSPATTSTLDPKALLASFRRRWLMAVSFGILLGGGVAAAVFVFLPPRYTVQALLHVASIQPSIIAHGNEGGANAFWSYQKTQLVMVKSKLVLNAVLRQPRVTELQLISQQPDPVAWLEKEVSADFSKAPEILRISMTGQQTAELAVLVNAVRDAYISQIVDRERLEKVHQLEKMRSVSDELETQLAKTKRERRTFAMQAGSRDPATLQRKQQYAYERLSMTQHELWSVQSQLRAAEVENLLSDEKDASTIALPESLVSDQVEKDPTVGRLREAIAADEEKLGETLRTVVQGESDPSVKRIRGKIATANEDLEARRKKVRRDVETRLRQNAGGNIKATTSARAGFIKRLQANEKMLADQVKDMEERLNAMSSQTLQVEDANDSVAEREDIAKRMRNQIATLEVDMKAPPRVRPLEEAGVAGTVDENRQLKYAGVAGGGVFGLALLGICWWDSRARRVSSPLEVQQALNLRVVGTLPTMQQRRAGRYGQNLMVESVDAMRTSLMHFARVESLRSVMVTSALPGEGKTSLAGHLAASLARAGCRTLLVDADLRNPAAHRLFDIPLGEGLSELLRGEATIEEVTLATRVPGLSMICAGRKDRAAIDALSHRASELFRQLEESYDLVIVDSSPVLPVADALLVGQQVDAVIFAVLCDVSRMPALLAAHERMTMLGFRILGAVVNGVRQETYGSTY
jgi:capsular exopolysaccharide synthesis family protein